MTRLATSLTIGAMEWVHGLSDRYKRDCAQFASYQWTAIRDMLKQIYQSFGVYAIAVSAELYRTHHLDATVSSNLSIHPLFSITPQYWRRLYYKHKMGYGLRDANVRNSKRRCLRVQRIKWTT